VELFEGLTQLRVLTDLRANWNQIAIRLLDEVPMGRNLGNEHVRWIGDGGPREGEQHHRCAKANQR